MRLSGWCLTGAPVDRPCVARRFERVILLLERESTATIPLVSFVVWRPRSARTALTGSHIFFRTDRSKRLSAHAKELMYLRCCSERTRVPKKKNLHVFNERISPLKRYFSYELRGRFLGWHHERALSAFDSPLCIRDENCTQAFSWVHLVAVQLACSCSPDAPTSRRLYVYAASALLDPRSLPYFTRGSFNKSCTKPHPDTGEGRRNQASTKKSCPLPLGAIGSLDFLRPPNQLFSAISTTRNQQTFNLTGRM